MAAALGLGELTLKSYLNEPLVAEVKLLEIGDLDPSQIRVRLATREDFSRAGVERAYFLTSLRFEVVGTPSGGALLQIRSSDPVREPFLDFIVEARWPTGRLLREYTILLDPPIFVGDDSGITARASASDRRAGRPSRSESPSRQTAQSTSPAPRAPTQRNYDARATDRPISGEEYLVQRSDTLWRIAEAGRPSGASVQQTMLDIQRMNPEAFIGGNINQLKAGYILRMPTASDITPQSFEEAVREVERQTQRWQSGVSSVDRLDASEGLDVSGVAGSDSGEGHLQIAGVDSSDETPTGGDVSARMEDLDRAQRENVELGTRLSAMEEQMEMQERLISLKDEQIAALQQALERAGADVDMPEGQEGTIESLDAMEDEPAQVTPDTQPEAAGPQPAAPQPAAPQPATPRPAPPAPVAPPPPTILDMVMENILYVAGGLLALILLVVLLLRKKLLPGRNKDQELPMAAVAAGGADEFADVSLSDDSLVVDEFDEDADEGAADIEAPAPAGSGYSGADEQYAAQFESGDALAEADIYIAYGRFPQAVDLLKAAIAVEPINTDFRIKLMEACVEMGESGEFQQQYADLQVIGDENVLQRSRSLLEAVDGGEAWLQDLPDPTITPADVEAARASMGDGGGAAVAEDSLDLDLGLDADLEDAGDDTGLDIDESELTASADEAGALDLDIDDADSGLGIDDEETDLGLELDTESASLDDDTGIDFSSEPALEELDEQDEPEAEHRLEDDSDDSALELDGLLTDDAGDLEEQPAELEAADLNELTLETDDGSDELEEVDLPDLELDGLGDEPAAEESGEDDLLADLEGMGSDLGSDDSDGDLEGMSLSLDDEDGDLADLGADLDDGGDLDLGSSDLDTGSDLDGVEFDLSSDSDDSNLADIELDMSADPGEEDGLVFAADGDEMATKLDLARAYIDMGDHDGARSILEEVTEAGSEAQQGEARQLLEGID
ncbi:MAG: FimV/HubP family polar landmark protein [Halieaceae bacterium]|jgi:pilus assembly protein FimV|nr:FimV/HubP family polar landmark protein [Halieaceae bacterium]